MTQTIWTSSLLIAAVLLLRVFLGDRVTARLRYGLWLLPAVRLCVPVSVQRMLHLMPASRLSAVDLPHTAAARIAAVQPMTNPAGYGGEPSAAVQAAWTDGGVVLPILWGLGATAVLVWCLMVNRRFAGGLRKTRRYWGVSNAKLPVYTADLTSPCLYVLRGRPEIYIPETMADDPARLRHVLAHEDAHFRHFDFLWSAVRAVLLIVYWFDPLVWAMAFFSRRDCEQACDEAALRTLGEEERAAYGHTLIGLMAAGRPRDLVCGATTMTDSGRGMKERIRRIAKRPQTRAAAVFLLLVCVVLGAALTFTGSAAHTRACAMLRSRTPARVDVIRYDNKTGEPVYSALDGEKSREAEELFLSISHTKDNPSLAAEGTAEWEMRFDLSESDAPDAEKQTISLEFVGMSYLLVHYQNGEDRAAYFVRNPEKIIGRFRTLVDLPPVAMEVVSAEDGEFRLTNLDDTQTWFLWEYEYRLDNRTTGEGQAAQVSYAEDYQPQALKQGEPYLWKPGYGALEDGDYCLSACLTGDDGEPVWISVCFIIGEPSTKGEQSSAVSAAGGRTDQPEQLLFNCIQGPLLDSLFPADMRIVISGSEEARILSGGDWVSFFTDDRIAGVTFLDAVTEKPAGKPALRATPEAHDFGSLTVFEDHPQQCLIERNGKWGCYRIPDGFLEELTALAEKSGTAA